MAEQSIPIFYTAAGGVVVDSSGERVLLLIRPSRDEVRLPKGHLEPDETPQAAALREVAEETGYADLAIISDLGQQLVAFTLGKHTAVRRTEHYFLMRLNSSREASRPKPDEQFFPVWVSWDEASAHLTFDAEREWIRRAKIKLEASL